MKRASVLREFADRVERGDPVALATRIAGETDVGAKLLVDRSGSVLGTLGSRDLDETVAAYAIERFGEGASRSREFGGDRIFVEFHLPPPRLVIVGAVHLASTLGRLAREMGFEVIVCDARGRFATPERFPDVDELILGWPNEILPRLDLDEFSYVVVVTHDAKLDNPALIAALKSPAPYIGALGSKRTHARRMEALREAGVGERDLARIHSPIGLDIGARTPQEIALATMAEVVSARNASGRSRA